MHRFRLALASAVSLALAACGSVGSGDPAPLAQTKADEWPRHGNDLSETRYSTLKQIDATNAKRLGLAWSYVMGAGGGNQEGTPLVYNCHDPLLPDLLICRPELAELTLAAIAATT